MDVIVSLNMQVWTHEKPRSTHGGGGVCALSPQGAGSGGAVCIHGAAAAINALYRAAKRGSAERTHPEIGLRGRILPKTQSGGQHARRTSQRGRVGIRSGAGFLATTK